MTDLKNLKKVKGFDIEKYDGVTSKIGEVELLDIKEKDFGNGLVQTRQIKVSSENLNSEGEEVFATEYVSLKLDKKTNIFGIPENSESVAMKFLKYFKVNDFEELKGVKCSIVKRIGKNNKEFLGIHFG